MSIINPFVRSQSGPAPVVTCTITSPSSGATLTQGTPVTISGVIGVPGTVLVKLGAVTLGSATVVGLAWSYSWTPLIGDIGAQTLNATTTPTAGGPAANAPAVTVTVAAPSFTGDFAALAAGYSLTVNRYVRGDLGLSGSQGTGFAAWANQAGTGGNVVPTTTGSADGIGAAGAGLNGKASLIQNGATQAGKYSMPAQAAPGTTNRHKYWVFRLLSTASFMRVLGPNSSELIAVVNIGDPDFTWGDDEPPTTTRVLNTWYRGRVSYTGGTLGASGTDKFRIGSEEKTWGTAVGVGQATYYVGCDGDNGALPGNLEWLLQMDIQGPMASFLSFAADADAKIRTFWTTDIEI